MTMIYDTDEERRRREQDQGGAQTGAPPVYGQSPTFAEMQKAGRARPGPQYSPVQYLPGGVQGSYGPQGSDPNPSGPQVQLPPGQTPFGQSLLAKYQNYQGPGRFQGQTNVQRAPRYMPGASPMTGGYQPGGVNMSYSTVAAPGLRETGGFNPGQSVFNPQLEQLLGSMLGNPSAYNQDAVVSTFNRLSGQIDDDFKQREVGLEEDMARRGLADSSIRGGRLADLNVGKRSARIELADRLTEKMAETQAADTARAIAQAMGYGSQTFNQGLAGFQANLGANAQNFQQDLASRAFQGDQNAMEVLRNLDIAGFNRASGQMGFENEMSARGFNRQLGLDQFGADMDSARFASGEDQRRYGNEANQFGMNLGADQQGFSQQQALLNSLLGYEQQGFDNRMRTDTFNADNAFRDKALETQFLGALLNSGLPGPEGGSGGVNSNNPIQYNQAQVNALQQLLRMGVPYAEAYERIYGGQK